MECSCIALYIFVMHRILNLSCKIKILVNIFTFKPWILNMINLL